VNGTPLIPGQNDGDGEAAITRDAEERGMAQRRLAPADANSIMRLDEAG
jgi:hypothetical protein